jgi:hypothetical protein
MAIVMAITPLGQDLVYMAFFSVEDVTRTTNQPIFFMAFAGLVVFALVEFGIRRYIHRARAR